MEILSRATWGAAPPTSTTAMTNPLGWVVHWVGGPSMLVAPTIQQSCALMRSLQSAAFAGLHGDVYVDFEYNFSVDPLGRIFEGRGWLVESGANGANYNANEWSVVYLAGPGVPLTAAAKQSLLWLTQEGARRDRDVSSVRPHDHLPGDSTGCPGPDLTPYSDYLNAHLHDAPVSIAPKVAPMHAAYTATWSADCNCPTGGAWMLTADGGVITLGTAPYKGSPHGLGIPLEPGVTWARIDPWKVGDPGVVGGGHYTCRKSNGAPFAF